jgi:hypothetical protein
MAELRSDRCHVPPGGEASIGSVRELESERRKREVQRLDPKAPDDPAASRRSAEEVISQRLYSIILAVHAAEQQLADDPVRLAAILALIRTQSVASLEELRRLSTLP